MGNIVEPEVIGVHCRPWFHGINNDCRGVAIQIVLNKVSVFHVRQPIDRFQGFASLRGKLVGIKMCTVTCNVVQITWATAQNIFFTETRTWLFNMEIFNHYIPRNPLQWQRSPWRRDFGSCSSRSRAAASCKLAGISAKTVVQLRLRDCQLGPFERLSNQRCQLPGQPALLEMPVEARNDASQPPVAGRWCPSLRRWSLLVGSTFNE